MTQDDILEQCLLYLNHTWKDYVADLRAENADVTDQDIQAKVIAEKQEHQKYFQDLQKTFHEGYCFGFAVCHGFMALAGKDRWWEDVLTHINDWDGTKESLDKLVQLKDARNDRKIKLREIFELAINYIVHSHSVPRKIFHDFLGKDSDQQNALLPDHERVVLHQPMLRHFEMLDDDGRLITIQDNQRAVGLFTKDQMQSLLDEETCQHHLCLVSSHEHSMHVRHLGKGLWQLYDPSSTRLKASELVITGNKDKIIDEIFIALGTQEICIEVASIRPDLKINLSAYEKYLQHDAVSLLAADSVYLMARHAPGTLATIIQRAKTPDARARLRDKITAILGTAEYKKRRNLLHMLATYDASALSVLLSLMDETKAGQELKEVVASRMIEQMEKTQATPLHLMAVRAPESLQQLLNSLDNTRSDRNIMIAIAKALRVVMPENESVAMNVMITFSPQVLPDLFNLAVKPFAPKELRTALAESLLKVDDDGMSTILKILSSSPSTFPVLWRFIENAPECEHVRALIIGNKPEGKILRASIAKALVQQVDKNSDVFHLLMREPSQEVSKIIMLVLRDHDHDNNLYYLLCALAANVDGETGWQCITNTFNGKDKAQVLDLIAGQLQYLKTPQLINFAKRLEKALTDDTSEFRGLCSERHTMFQYRNEYGKTSIWRKLITQTQALLRERNDVNNKDDLDKILKINANR